MYSTMSQVPVLCYIVTVVTALFEFELFEFAFEYKYFVFLLLLLY